MHTTVPFAFKPLLLEKTSLSTAFLSLIELAGQTDPYLPPQAQLYHKLQRLIEEQRYIQDANLLFQRLTKRELEIISLVAGGHKRKDIAERLFISLHTYDTHRRNIREKLQLRSSIELFHFAQAFGLPERNQFIKLNHDKSSFQ